MSQRVTSCVEAGVDFWFRSTFRDLSARAAEAGSRELVSQVSGLEITPARVSRCHERNDSKAHQGNQDPPESVQRDVFDPLVFLKTRLDAEAEGAENLLPLAQTAWAADWIISEEGGVWHKVCRGREPAHHPTPRFNGC